MKIFLVGDSYSGTGPANVTKYYIEYLPKGTLYQKCKSKVLRVPELIYKIMLCDVALFSGYSKQNIVGMKIASIFKKKTAYLMHGCVEYENQINHEEDEEMCLVERKTMNDADLILAVSPSFAKWLQEHYKEHALKIDYLSNAIDESLIERAKRKSSNRRNPHMIFSVGGGMPRKKIKYICKAIERLQPEYNNELKLVVVGNVGADSEEINNFSFVENKGLVPFVETVRLYEEASLFIQNSCFETFGLAFVEAVSCGCAALISKEVGALSLVDNIRESDVIERFDDVEEIADKIRGLLSTSNAEYISNNICWESNTWKVRSQQLVQKLELLIS